MNDLGHVAGEHRQCGVAADEAFYWTPETGLVTMPRPNDVHTARSNDINDHGLVVGNQLFTGDGDMPIGWRGFVYDIATGEYTYLEPKYEGGSSWANAINNDGVVAGSRTIDPDGGQSPFNAVIWNTNTGEVTDLGVMNGPNSSALDVNDADNVAVGWDGQSVPSTVAGFWNDGEFTSLGVVPGTDSSHAVAVNDSMMIVGRGADLTNFVWRAFIWKEGVMTVIDPIEPFVNSSALSTNDLGQVGLTMSKSGVFRGFLWQNGEIHDVNDLLVEAEDIVIESVGSLNNHGQIRASVGTKTALLSTVDSHPTDLNYDCRTDIHDLLILLNAWGLCEDPDQCPADFTGDGTVGVPDLLILIANWG